MDEQGNMFYFNKKKKGRRLSFWAENAKEAGLTRALECWGWSTPVGRTPENLLHTEGTTLTLWFHAVLMIRFYYSMDSRCQEFLTNLQNNAGGLVKIHHLFNDRLEQLPVAWNAHRCESWHWRGCQLPMVTMTRTLRV